MQKNKVLTYLGLATRAGKTVSGEFSVEKSLKQRKARLVVVSEEASENTKKKFRNMCEYRKTPLYFFGTGVGVEAVIWQIKFECMSSRRN